MAEREFNGGYIPSDSPIVGWVHAGEWRLTKEQTREAGAEVLRRLNDQARDDDD